MSTNTEPPKSMQPCQVKLVLLGTSAVGKSSIVLRFVQNDFQENKEPTIGAAFLTQKCRLEDKVIKFEIWDTAGQERFASLAPMYYRNAAAAVVVYDITVESSLAKAQSWVKELQRQSNPNIVIALVGNKLDLVSSSSSDAAADPTPSNATAEDEEADDATATPDTPNGDASKRQVAKETAAAYAAENGLLFFETSAKTGENVVEVFTEIAKKIPLDQILQQRGQGAGAGGRAGASRTASGANANAAGGQAGRVQLGDNAEAKTDSCAC